MIYTTDEIKSDKYYTQTGNWIDIADLERIYYEEQFQGSRDYYEGNNAFCKKILEIIKTHKKGEN